MTTSEALVFDLKRFAVHDGAGIRTTVFLKGCPLRCVWCQNPEGLEARRQPVFLKKQCIGCRSCLKAQDMDWNGGPMLDHSGRTDYSLAMEACPAAAIRWDSKKYSLDDLFEEMLKDQVFFRQGGGITFSGGEPLMQADAVKELARRAREAGIHTAIESSFFCDNAKVREVLPYMDQIFCDCKLLDEQEHERYTGVSNKVILENIAWMLSQPSLRERVTVRTPLIPGITATDENIKAVCSYVSGLFPGVKYELLNYNPLASAKYEMTGRTWTLDKLKPFSKEEMAHFEKAAGEAGIVNLIKE